MALKISFYVYCTAIVVKIHLYRYFENQYAKGFEKMVLKPIMGPAVLPAVSHLKAMAMPELAGGLWVARCGTRYCE